MICQLCYFSENIEWALKGHLIDIIYFPELPQATINKLVRGLYCNQYLHQKQISYGPIKIGVEEWGKIVLQRGDELFLQTPEFATALNSNNGWLNIFREAEGTAKTALINSLSDFRAIAKETAFSADELNHFSSANELINLD